TRVRTEITGRRAFMLRSLAGVGRGRHAGGEGERGTGKWREKNARHFGHFGHFRSREPRNSGASGGRRRFYGGPFRPLRPLRSAAFDPPSTTAPAGSLR